MTLCLMSLRSSRKKKNKKMTISADKKNILVNIRKKIYNYLMTMFERRYYD